MAFMLTPSEVLGAMITPAVLISAAGTLVLSTSNRLSRVVDRVRVLGAEAERLCVGIGPADAAVTARMRMLAEQLERQGERALMLRTALTVLYTAIGLLVSTSIGVGIAALFEWRYGWVAVVLGLLGAGALLWASLLLVREARLAVGSTLQELECAHEAVSRKVGAHGRDSEGV